MLRLTKKAAATVKKPGLRPGIYTSTVVSVESAPGYAEGHAQQVSYELADSAGNVYTYREIFRTAEPVGQRSENFFDYLADNGITEWEQLVGCQERVTLLYEFVGSRKYLNIVERQFAYEDEEGEEGESDATAK